MLDPPTPKTPGKISPLVETTQCPIAAVQTSATQVYCANTTLLFLNTMKKGSGMDYPRTVKVIHISVSIMLLFLEVQVA